MSGKRITDQQYELYTLARRKGMTQVIASAKAGFCERTGRALEVQGILPSHKDKKNWQRREDPFAAVWESLLVPLLQENPYLSSTFLLETLQEKYPDEYPDRHLRTLQRRLQKWKTLYGPEKEVMFRQEHPPGLRGLSDFTHPKTFEVTIQGKKFPHLLYHFRLAYSQWSSMKIVQGGESFTALSEGLQEALWSLGGCPLEHRTDSLSAAFKNLSAQTREDLTRRYESLCQNYQMEPSRNNRGKGHENGSIEGPHGHLKRRLRQNLALRGSCDFESIEAYQKFINTVVNRHNKRHISLIEEEKLCLQPLPLHRACDFEEIIARVTTSSTIIVRGVIYSVPSRLIGQRLRVHLYDGRLSCYMGSDHVLDLSRVLSKKGEQKKAIDYRHVIHSLARKPQAFRYSVLRDELLPTPVYKEIWKMLDQKCTARHACKLMVGILKIAADHSCEEPLGERVLKKLRTGKIPTLGELQKKYKPTGLEKVPVLSIVQHSLRSYDKLLAFFKTNIKEVGHA
jgi:hypothetical protein